MSYPRRDRLPIPPKQADRIETVCQYCTVGCGYTVFRWPAGREGGPRPNENAFGVDFGVQQAPLLGRPYTESMHAEVMHRGRRANLVIVPATILRSTATASTRAAAAPTRSPPSRRFARHAIDW